MTEVSPSSVLLCPAPELGRLSGQTGKSTGHWATCQATLSRRWNTPAARPGSLAFAAAALGCQIRIVFSDASSEEKGLRMRALGAGVCSRLPRRPRPGESRLVVPVEQVYNGKQQEKGTSAVPNTSPDDQPGLMAQKPYHGLACCHSSGGKEG